MRLFITVSQLGLCDDNGKKNALVCGYKKRLAEKNKPVSTLFIPLIEEALDIVGWDTEEDKLVDLGLLKEYFAVLYDGEVNPEPAEPEKILKPAKSKKRTKK